MLKQFTVYHFDPKNKKTLIFIPGYSSGLSAPIIKALAFVYSEKKTCDVLGLEMFYERDTPDAYDQSLERIQSAINELAVLYPKKELMLVAKSLGGALCLHVLNDLKVAGLVVLGFPVVLGWPQRISLLSSKDFKIPDYKSEWLPILNQIRTPVRIVSGDSDDLTDNDFLKEISEQNNNIHVSILKDATHGLVSTKTGETHIEECIKELPPIFVAGHSHISASRCAIDRFRYFLYKYDS